MHNYAHKYWWGWWQNEIYIIEHWQGQVNSGKTRGGGALMVVHMCDQRFLRHTLIAISPSKGKNPKWEFCVISPKFTPIEAFFKDMISGIWLMAPKQPLIESKRTLFIKYRYTLTPSHDSCQSLSLNKNNPFSCFSCTCTTILFESQHPPVKIYDFEGTFIYNQTQSAKRVHFIDDTDDILWYNIAWVFKKVLKYH